MCYKTNYIAIREQFEWLKDFEAKEQKTSKDQNGQGAMTLKRAATKMSRYNDFNDQEDEDLEKFQHNQNTKKLEQFDTILDDINLELSEFLEEMAE